MSFHQCAYPAFQIRQQINLEQRMALILLDIYGHSTVLNADSAVLNTFWLLQMCLQSEHCCTLEVMFEHSLYSPSAIKSFKRKNVWERSNSTIWNPGATEVTAKSFPGTSKRLIEGHFHKTTFLIFGKCNFYVSILQAFLSYMPQWKRG